MVSVRPLSPSEDSLLEALYGVSQFAVLAHYRVLCVSGVGIKRQRHIRTTEPLNRYTELAECNRAQPGIGS